MTIVPAKLLYGVLENTWPAANLATVGPWTIRNGKNGGQRVSATTASGRVAPGDLVQAEQAMNDLDQVQLFMIREGDETLDTMLAENGYQIKDPVTVYACPTHILTAEPPSRMSAFSIWPPLQIMKDMWAEGGVGPGRLAVMDRTPGPKMAILSRQNERAAGAGFVAIHGETAMIHAVEVISEMRRQGAGVNIMRAAAKWAQDAGATKISVVVTDANTGANALYANLGMTIVGHYHYRIKQKE